MGFHKILCPIDFSAGSRIALTSAAELARASNAPLVLLYVSERSPWQAMTGFQLVPEVVERVAASEQTELAAWQTAAKELGVADVSSRLVTGTPWDRIVAMARDDRAIDLIVMGTHGRTGLEHALIGSVAEKTIRHAPCSVFVVRKPA